MEYNLYAHPEEMDGDSVLIQNFIYDDPQCAAICPSIGCITWDMTYTKEFEEHFLNEEMYKLGSKNGTLKTPSFREKKYRKDIPLQMRGVGKEVQVEPEDIEVG